jgi:peptide/nickel transport system substrate-binding protein
MLAAVLTACSSGNQPGSAPAGDTGGTLIIALPVSPSSLMPGRIGSTHERQVVDQVFDVLADIGPGLNTDGDAGFTPRLAESWTWSTDSLSIRFAVHPAARWHDSVRVTSSDVRFSLEYLRDPSVSLVSQALSIVDSVSTPDSLTAVAWFARRAPDQFYRLAYNLWILPEHLLGNLDQASIGESEFARRPIGSGPFRMTRWESRQVLELAASESYHLGRPLLDRVIWQVTPDLTGALMQVVNGEADVLETLTPDAMARIAVSEHVRAVEFLGFTYGYLGFNMRDPTDPSRVHALFSDKALRTAVAMSLDREAMLRNVFASLAFPGHGPFTRNIATSDSTIPGAGRDTVRADHLLDSLGWRRGPDGMRNRAGRPLAFSLLIPSSSASRNQYAELIQAQLRSRGIRMDIEAPDPNVAFPRYRAGQFDALINAWTTDPSPAAFRNSWYSAPPANRGNNFQAWSSRAFDATIDSAVAELDPALRTDLFRRSYRILVDDVAAVWLFETRPFVAVHKRIRTVGESSDTWWRFLRLWWIPATERITRDTR